MLKRVTLRPRRFFTPDPTGSAHVQTLIQISSKTDHNIQNLRFRSHPAVFPFRTRLSVCVLVSFFSPPASRPQRSQRVPRARIDGGVPTSLFQRSHMLSVHTPTLQPRRPILVASSFPPLTYHPIPHHPLPGPLSPSRPPDSPTFLSIRSCLPLAMTSPYPTTKTPTPVHNPQFLSPITFFFSFPYQHQHTPSFLFLFQQNSRSPCFLTGSFQSRSHLSIIFIIYLYIFVFLLILSPTSGSSQLPPSLAPRISLLSHYISVNLCTPPRFCFSFDCMT